MNYLDEVCLGFSILATQLKDAANLSKLDSFEAKRKNGIIDLDLLLSIEKKTKNTLIELINEEAP